jgi:sodium transport system ATP-binding protein
VTYVWAESVQPMIEVQNLTKTYDDMHRGRFVAVDDVSFEVRKGQIFGLLGPNGAGKTTVLRILSTVLRPTSGTAKILGYDVVEDAAQVRGAIGFVSNNTATYDRMTAFELVEYFGRLHAMPRELLKDRMATLFDQLRMNDFRDIPCGKLSTGMKQKVSIARALVHDPPVLVFDEATLGLDVLVARNLLDVIRHLREIGKCLIFSTHIMREVERLCDSIAIMHQGRILDIGTLDQLRERHAEHDFEELFFGVLSRSDRETQEMVNQRWMREDASIAPGPSGVLPDVGMDITGQAVSER